MNGARHKAQLRSSKRDTRRKLVVIGHGTAATATVEEILARGGASQFAITVFGGEPHGGYSRIMLCHALSGEGSDSENAIELHAGVTGEQVDKNTRHVFSSDGRVTPYDVLIIATGSRFHLPPVGGLLTPAGTTKAGVFALCTADDVRKLVESARQGHRCRAVVAGGGPLGLEAAQELRSRGMEVEVVHSAGHLLDAHRGFNGGAVLRKSVEALGVRVHEGSRVTDVLGVDRVTGVRLGDKPDIECDMAVVAAGARPNVDLAVLSGLPVERAIVVDDQLRVQDEDSIYAVGECVQHRDRIYSQAASLQEQAVVLAKHITGSDPRAAYLGSRSDVFRGGVVSRA